MNLPVAALVTARLISQSAREFSRVLTSVATIRRIAERRRLPVRRMALALPEVFADYDTRRTSCTG